jgi:xanthine dehydrogenase small subunit
MPLTAALFTMLRMKALPDDSVPIPRPLLRFVRRGEIVSLNNVPPSRTLLDLLRDDLGCTGTKEGCGEGDCGACTVVLGEDSGDGRLKYRAVNSCIRLAHSVDGLALWTVEDIAPTLPTACGSLPPEGAACRGSKPACAGLDGTQKDCVTQSGGLQGMRLRPGEAGSAAPAGDGKGSEPSLHPAQVAMVEAHGSQCGFCTPGFVMSLFGMYQNHVCKGKTITRALAQEELAGNLCRCTGYQPIFKAAQAMAALPVVAVDEAGVLSNLKLLAPGFTGLQRDSAYKLPKSLPDLLAARAAHPEAQLVAGCTDVGLWITKQHREFDHIIDLTQVAELRRIEHYPNHVAIGAAVPLADAYAALTEDRPQLKTFAARFAGLPVRNSGTLGGNVANGSPIGDSMPLLIAMRASIMLMSAHGHREMAVEDLYTGYRTNVMAADEVLAWVKVPKAGRPNPGLQIYKISKRFDDDISTVCLAIDVRVESGKVVHASIGAGGVAATPVRARKTEAALVGQPWTFATVQHAMATLRAEFSPISDMRASSDYRREVIGNLLQRYWFESQGMQQINLQSFTLEEAA